MSIIAATATPPTSTSYSEVGPTAAGELLPGTAGTFPSDVFSVLECNAVVSRYSLVANWIKLLQMPQENQPQ